MDTRESHPDQSFGLNSTYVDTLRSQWRQNAASVPYEWREFFAEETAAPAAPEPTPAPAPVEAPKPAAAAAPAKPAAAAPAKAHAFASRASDLTLRDGDEAKPLRGIAKKIVENMEASLDVPTATSTRDLPVKVLEENRRIINQFLVDDARPRCSFTHLIAYAIVKAATEVPSMNNGYFADEKGPNKVLRRDINMGLAVDLPARDGSRTLVVPSIKAAQDMDFWTFFEAYNGIIARARKNKLKPDEFMGTTITLTNPGGIGTVSSMPRLMPTQGTIVAAGRIGYPAEYEASAPETLRALGIGKVMTVSSTYDHRVIQGAESGRFLKYMHELLVGEHGFYDEVFQSLRIPHHPYKLVRDRAIVFGTEGQMTATERAMKVSQLIHAYRVRGYMLANTDPLDLQPREHPELNLETYGLTLWDLDREFSTLGTLPEKTAPFRQILQRLRDAYARRMGVEYMYISDPEKKAWMQKRAERDLEPFDVEEKTRFLEKLTEAENFERFLHKRFLGHKRFSVEGGESVIPMLDELLNTAASHNVTDVMIGMAHRGRLNVLANIMGKSHEAIFAEFDDIDPKTMQGSGDVKYHLGAKGLHLWKGPVSNAGGWDEREVRIELACNPSHLEAVSPVVLGQTRARQDLIGDHDRSAVVPVLIHGDAAFAGQGVVFETMQMSNLLGYRVGGAVHIIINNQIGYTTGPDKARTAQHASDVARAIGCPVWRVNGDDPEACIRAVRMAFEYRQRFGDDVVIDMVCYRRHGHNEGDEPSFTQPILYKAIRQHSSVRERYARLLVRRKDLAEADVETIQQRYEDTMERALSAIREKGNDAIPDLDLVLPGEADPDATDDPVTAVSKEHLEHIATRLSDDPETVDLHPRIKRNILDRRRGMMFDAKPGIDFGMAENLAYGSLLLEGMPVRISGQDVGRGTFAHRHAILYDVNTGKPYIPLNTLDRNKQEGDTEWKPSKFRIFDSFLSEEAVLGFEYGYSVTHPDSLVIWEAQFGDFFNGAQIQVDQFISSGEAKWGQLSRVTMLLPHGYDGQGPEHSSARVERFLQMCAEDNMRVCNTSTAGNYFHLLRHQAMAPKKPLIVFTHKSLLRAEDASAKLDDLTAGSFQPVLDDPRVSGKAKRLVFTTGKVYWDVDRVRAENPSDDIAIVRLEQMYPFPAAEVQAAIDKYAPEEVVWLQEEPKNMGAYRFMQPYFFDLKKPLTYVGRASAASPATGSKKRHTTEQKAVIAAVLSTDALTGDVDV